MGKPSWLSEMTLSLTEGLPVSPTISGKTCPLIALLYFSTMPPHYALTLKVLTPGSRPHPPALWPSPLPVSKALSVRSPRALMSRKGLFPMPMETICCTRSSRKQRPRYQQNPSAPSLLQAPALSWWTLLLLANSHSSGISCYPCCQLSLCGW